MVSSTESKTTSQLKPNSSTSSDISVMAVTRPWTTLYEFCALCILTFLIVLPYFCQNLHHSWYFTKWKDENDARNQLIQENDSRVKSAQEYLNAISHVGRIYSPVKNGESNGNQQEIVISVITHARTRYFPEGTDPRYLTQNVAQFLKLLQRWQKESSLKFYLFMCNVDPDPDFHKEVLTLSKHVTLVNRFQKLSLPMVHPKEKEKQDYQFCLNQSLSYGKDFVFLVEDDALPLDDTLTVLQNTLKYFFSTIKRSHLIKEKVSYIKFYHPERLLGYLSASPERLPELLCFSGLLSFALTCLYKSYRRTNINATVVWFVLFIYFTFIALSIGRTNLLESRRLFSPFLYSLSPAPSCCTQAILYPRTTASNLVRYMNNATCGNNYAKDHVIEEHSVRYRLSAHLVQPGTFKHIGLYSALRNQIVDPFLL